MALGSAAADAKRHKRSGAKAAGAHVDGAKGGGAKDGGAKGGGAKQARKKVAVVPLEGVDSKNAAVGTKVGQTLKQHKIQVVAGARVKKSIRKDGAPSSDEDWVKLARKLKVDGIVAFTLSQEGSERSVNVAIRNGSDGAVAGQETFTAKGTPKRLATVLGKSLWDKLGSAIQDVAGPKKEDESTGLRARDLSPTESTEPGKQLGIEPSRSEGGGLSGQARASKPKSEPGPEKKVAAADKEGEGKADEEKEAAEKTEIEPAPAPTPAGPLEIFEGEADLRVLQRGWQYVPSTAAQNFTLPFYTPVLGTRLSLYPLRNFGVFATGEISAGLTGHGFPTDAREFLFGAAVRLPFSFGRVGASVAYFQHDFLIKDTANQSDASRLTLDYPNTVYRGARFGASARFRIGSRFQLGVEGGYRLVTSAGADVGQVKAATYFPMSKAPIGVDGGAFVGFRLGVNYELRAGFDYRRYAFGALQGTTFANTVINATGAVDQYLALFAGVAGVLGGK